MKSREPQAKPVAKRCAIYTRKSSEEGLQQEFNSLDAQRESAEAYIKSQQHEGWTCLPDRYDDGGFTGGNMERPGLRKLMHDIATGNIDCVVVYKLDRLSRSLLDFTKMMEVFDRHQVSFVSTTQQFHTGTSMGRLMLNALLSFAQFEREIISERTRDKMAATRKKGKWSGGQTILGYQVNEHKKLVVNETEARQVRRAFELYREHEAMLPAAKILNDEGICTQRQTTREGTIIGGKPFSRTSSYRLLTNPLYTGRVRYKGEMHPGEHEAIISIEDWDRVQAIMKRNGRTSGSAVRTSNGAMLKGLLRCKCCDCSMTPSHTKRGHKHYRYYTCLRAQKQGRDSCPTKSVPAGEMEKVVVDRIRCIGRDEVLFQATITGVRHQDEERLLALEVEQQELERERAKLGGEFRKLSQQHAGDDTKLMRLWGDRQETLIRLEDRLTTIASEVTDARKAGITEAEARDVLVAFDPVWDSLTTSEKSRILRLLIERIEYDGSSAKLSIAFHSTGIRTLADEIANERRQV